MKKFNLKPLSLLTILLLCGVFHANGQDFINGSFEDNTGVEGINLTNPAFNAAVANCIGSEDFGAGGVPNLDLITIRYYNDAVIEELTNNKKVYFEEVLDQTIQLIVQ